MQQALSNLIQISCLGYTRYGPLEYFSFILSLIRLIVESKHLVLFVALSILVTGETDSTEEKTEKASNKGVRYTVWDTVRPESEMFIHPAVPSSFNFFSVATC